MRLSGEKKFLTPQSVLSTAAENALRGRPRAVNAKARSMERAFAFQSTLWKYIRIFETVNC